MVAASCWRIVFACVLLLHHHHTQAGRLFVTLLGYPGSCTRNHVSHSCTLSFSCWLAGGTSEAGCGASPWWVACCVTAPGKDNNIKDNAIAVSTNVAKNPLQMFQDNQLEVIDHEEFVPEVNMLVQSHGGLENMLTKHRSTMLQRRADADADSQLNDAEYAISEEDELDAECGISADRVLHRRIIGGTEARFAQFPWQAHIRIAAYQCGGVLVSRNFVATAAHCIVRARLAEITVHLGELDTQDTGQVLELAPAEKHRVKRRLVHPRFRFRITQPDRYDLALLQLSTSAGRMFHIAPVCLPYTGMRLQGRSGVVAGWGKIRPSTDLTGTNVLRSAVVPILDSTECISWHNTRQISVELHEDMVCAGHADGSSDACLGDSGGPLIVLERGRWTLVGITSAGFGCGEPHQPGIYHNVAITAEWIRSVIMSH